MNRPAKFKQSDLARAIRAAKQAGAGAVEVKPDGTITVTLEPGEKPQKPVDDEREIVL